MKGKRDERKVDIAGFGLVVGVLALSLLVVAW
jgi:hypothetical protein